MAKKLIPFDRLKPDKGIKFSRVHLDRLEQKGLFPRKVKLGPAKNASVGWIEDEIDAYLDQLMADRDALAQQAG